MFSSATFTPRESRGGRTPTSPDPHMPGAIGQLQAVAPSPDAVDGTDLPPVAVVRAASAFPRFAFISLFDQRLVNLLEWTDWGYQVSERVGRVLWRGKHGLRHHRPTASTRASP